jgi:hypothetical protein
MNTVTSFDVVVETPQGQEPNPAVAEGGSGNEQAQPPDGVRPCVLEASFEHFLDGAGI